LKGDFSNIIVKALKCMSLQYRPESELGLEKSKPLNGGLPDFLGKFLYSLQVEKLKVLIEKK